MVFVISLFLVVALSLVAGVAPELFEAFNQAALQDVIQHAGWLYLLIVFLTLIFLVYVSFSAMGRLRIGGRDADPKFSTSAWLPMLFAAGMGMGMAIALIAATMLLAGGLGALQSLIIVAALPFAVSLLAVMISMKKVLSQALHQEQAKKTTCPTRHRSLDRTRGASA